jgi:hypothetical protein
VVAVVGANTTAIDTVCPASTTIGSAGADEAKLNPLPVTFACETVIAVVPELASETFWVA